jgi:hypothetical protein
MTSGADRDGKAYHPRRARRTQLHEAVGSALGQLQPQSPSDLAAPEGGDGEAPHYHGHRERLRSRLREAGQAALADYDSSNSFFFERFRDAM